MKYEGDMKSMKLPKKSGKANKGETMAVDSDSKEQYPYGLKIRLGEDQIKKLEKTFNLDVEDKVMVMAKGYICEKNSHDMAGGKSDRTMEIQITDLCCDPAIKKVEEDPFFTK